MGTPMAVNYANIFLDKFENEMLNAYEEKHKLRPSIWIRYIDDIFLIWKGTKEELVNFITEINTVHESIKFDVNYSTSNVNFLDTTVTINPDHQIGNHCPGIHRRDFFDPQFSDDALIDQ